MREITVLEGYQYIRNSSGSYHRILNDLAYNALLEFYRSHLYIGGRFMDASVLNSSSSKLVSLAQDEIQKAKERLNILDCRGIPLQKDARLLELGCGYGVFLALWEQEGLGRSLGVDISNLAVPVSARLWSKAPAIRTGEIIESLSSSGDELGQYDIAVAFDVIEHIWHLDLVAGLVYAVLKPSGLFCVEVPMISPFWSSQEIIKFQLFHPQHHIHLFTLTGISAAFVKTSFIVRDVVPCENKAKRLIVFEK